jgi:hypothetical protein
MNDSTEALAPPGLQALASPRRARLLGGLSVLLGAASFAVLPVPLPSAFPWLTLGLSLAGVIAAIAALRTRPRGRLAVTLALAGLVISLAFPALVVVVFASYFNWKS